jgi:glycosyltransferase involved in cell wall biosynthesis
MRIVQLVVTDNFAGTERYAAQTSRELARRGHDVTVLGGRSGGMTAVLDGAVDWRPAATPVAALRAMVRVGQVDIVHTHLTNAEVAAALTRPVHRGAVVSTVHLATGRGSGLGGGLVRRIVEASLTSEVAISDYVAAAVAPRPVHVVRNGVLSDDSSYDLAARTVVMVQRLEADKDTGTGLLAWRASGLGAAGWSLVVVGDGSERESLQTLIRDDTSVQFVGYVGDVGPYLRRAAMLLATAPAEPFGLSVVEAMAAGVPVVASCSGGHLETIGSVPGAPLFGVGDVNQAARCLAELAAEPDRRQALSDAGRVVQRQQFSLDRQVSELEGIYRMALR